MLKGKFLAIIFLVCVVHSKGLARYKDFKKIQNKIEKKRYNPIFNLTPQKVNGFVKNFFIDSYTIGERIFTLQSMKILSMVVPFYLIGRKVDPIIHQQFYDAQNHKNINQPSKFFKTILKDEIMAIPFGIYGMYGLCKSDSQKRREAQLFTVGLEWTWSSKILLKEIKTDSGLRPWHEEYSRHKRLHGGSPSGHTSMATFMATYLWMVKGPYYGVPLSFYAGLVAGLSTAGNHHYISQIIAGAGLGIIVGVAAYGALQDLTLPKNLELSLATNYNGGLGIQLAYNF